MCSTEQECQLTSTEVKDKYHLDSKNGVLQTKGSYTIYSFTTPCIAGTELKSISECRHAQSKFTSWNDIVTPQIGTNVPKGCYRRGVGGSYSWYFNKHETGAGFAVHASDEYICLTNLSSVPRTCVCVCTLLNNPFFFVFSISILYALLFYWH